MTKTKAILMLVAAGIMWSLGGLLIKSINWSPLAISGLRSIVAAAIIYIFGDINNFKFKIIEIISAFFYVIVVTLFVLANKYTTAGNAILLQYTAPIYVAIFGYVFLKERAYLIDWFTICLLLVGLSFFFFDELSIDGLLGNIFAIVSGISFAGLTILLRKQKAGDPIRSIFLGNIFAFILGLPEIYSSTTSDIVPWALVLVLGIVQLGFSYILFTNAIKHVSALDAIIYPVIEPILNPILVFLFIGERLGSWSLIGGVLVVGSVLIRGLFQIRRS